MTVVESFRVGVLNLRRTNTVAQITDDLDVAGELLDVAGINEAEENGSTAFARWINAHRSDWAAFRPLGAAGAVPIMWRRSRFRSAGRGTALRTVKGKRGVSPTRYITRKPLRDRPSKTRGLVLCTHAPSGYRNDMPDQLWRDDAARRHMLAIAELTARELRSNRWDWIVLVGDLNAPLELAGPYWYPGELLAAMYRPDGATGRPIVRVLLARGGVATAGKPTGHRVNSDHPLEERTVRLRKP